MSSKKKTKHLSLKVAFTVCLLAYFLPPVVVLATTTTAPTAAEEPEKDEIFRVLVIGGGMSGLAAARHLMRYYNSNSTNSTSSPTRRRLQVDLLEAKPRLGGRIWTARTTNNNSRQYSTAAPSASSQEGQPHHYQSNFVAVDLGGMFWHGVESRLFQQLQAELQNWTTIPTQGNSINPGKGGAKWWISTATSAGSVNSATSANNHTSTSTATATATATTSTVLQELEAAAIDRLPDLVGRWNATMQQRIGAFLKEENAALQHEPASSTMADQRQQQQQEHIRSKEQDPARLLQWSHEFVASLPTEQERQLLRYQLHMIFDLDFGLPMEELALDGFANGWEWKDSLGDDHISLEGMAHVISALEQDILMQEQTAAVAVSSAFGRQSKTARIHRGQRVTKIRYSNGEAATTTTISSSSQSFCTVHTEDGHEWKAHACIVTLPIGVLKHRHLSLFDPPLETSKQEALQRTGIGALDTVAVQWNRPICTDPDITAYYFVPGSSNDEVSNDDATSTTAHNNNPLSHGFVCSGRFRTGDPTITQFHFSTKQPPQLHEKKNRNAEQEQQDIQNYWKRQAVEVVQKVLAHNTASSSSTNGEGTASCSADSTALLSESDIVDLFWSDWQADPDIMGSYSSPSTRSNGNLDRHRLAQSVGNSLFFAGEHTHTTGRYQSMDGAYETGVRAAQQVLESMDTFSAAM